MSPLKKSILLSPSSKVPPTRGDKKTNALRATQNAKAAETFAVPQWNTYCICYIPNGQTIQCSAYLFTTSITSPKHDHPVTTRCNGRDHRKTSEVMKGVWWTGQSQELQTIDAINNEEERTKHAFHRQVKLTIMGAPASKAFPNSSVIANSTGPRTKITRCHCQSSVNGGCEAFSKLLCHAHRFR